MSSEKMIHVSSCLFVDLIIRIKYDVTQVLEHSHSGPDPGPSSKIHVEQGKTLLLELSVNSLLLPSVER